MCRFIDNELEQVKQIFQDMVLETDEEMFDSDEENIPPNTSDQPLSQYYYINMSVNHFTAISDLIEDVIGHNRLHVFGKFYLFNNNRYCTTCYNHDFKLMEYHAIYDEMSELNMDIKSCILGKQLNLIYGRYFCTFCDCFLFNVEFAEEMNCDSCKLEIEEQDYDTSYINTHISNIFAVNE